MSSLLTATLCAVCLLVSLHHSTALECLHEYIQQPPTALRCNPFGSSLQLLCVATGPLDPQFQLTWYSSPANNSENVVELSSLPGYSVQTVVLNNSGQDLRTVSSMLVTTNINVTANGGPAGPSLPTTDNTPVPTSTVTLLAPEPESSTLPDVRVATIMILFAIISTLAITIVILYRCVHTNSKRTGDTSTPYPSPQAFLRESADGDYIDPSAAYPLYHNLTTEAANTEMGPPDERKEVYQSLDPTSVDYTSLYMTTNMQGSVAPTVQEGGGSTSLIVDRRKRDPPNLYANVTSD